MLASGTQDHGFRPGRSHRIFSGVKILSMPAFGREVKQFVPRRRFAARKRTLLDYVEVESLRPNYSDVSCSKFPPSLTEGSSDRVGSGLSVEVPLHSSSMGALWSWKEATKVTRCTKACIRPKCLQGYPGRILIYLCIRCAVSMQQVYEN
jgi:hypothetical protein